MNDITSQDILVKLNTQDIDSILNKFDINIIEAMEHFTNLMVAYIYSRDRGIWIKSSIKRNI